MTEKNLSFVFKEKRVGYFEERNKPTEIGDHDVLLKISNVGICGSDVHFWTDGYIGDLVATDPVILGHEASGVVIKCGEKVKTLTEGDRVCIEPGKPCGRCNFCKSGKYHLCQEIIFLSAPPCDGMLCQYIIHPEDFCYKLPNNVSNEEGALVEPLAVAVHACNRGGVALGSKVLIIGAGTIGLVNLLAARAKGAEKIVIVDVNEKRLEFAKNIGADFTILIPKNFKISDVVEEIEKKLDGLVDQTIECCGAPNAINLGIEATIAGGCVVIVGLGAPTDQISILKALMKEVDIRPIYRYVNCFPTALSLLSQERFNAKSIITHRFSFAECAKAFENVASGNGVKTMIDMGK